MFTVVLPRFARRVVTNLALRGDRICHIEEGTVATIVKRRKKDGSLSYLARIRIARRGNGDYTESRTFPRKSMAEERSKR